MSAAQTSGVTVERESVDERPVEDLSLRGLLAKGTEAVNNGILAFESWLIQDKRQTYGTSLARILAGSSIFGLLFTNLRVHSIMFGPGSVWNGPMSDISEYWPHKITQHMPTLVFTGWYLLVMLVALLFVLGWRTRLMGVLLVIGNTSIIEQNPVLGDQGDNIIRVGMILLCFMHTSEHWSLDARRRRRHAAVANSHPAPSGRGLPDPDVKGWFVNFWHSQYVLPRWFSNTVHNVAMAALAFNIVLIYISAGMFKTQGALWQHGTALYYPLQLQEYKPLPFLTDPFTHFGVVVGVSTYMAVFIQLFFAPLLLNKITRRVAFIGVIMLHFAIALLMALPWFSLSMIAFDCLFVSASTYQALERWITPRLREVADLFWDVVDPVLDRLRPSRVVGR